MGSPVSGFIAEAVMQSVEVMALKKYRPRLWHKHAHEAFVIINHNDFEHARINLMSGDTKSPVAKDREMNQLPRHQRMTEDQPRQRIVMAIGRWISRGPPWHPHQGDFGPPPPSPCVNFMFVPGEERLCHQVNETSFGGVIRFYCYFLYFIIIIYIIIYYNNVSIEFIDNIKVGL